MAERELDPQTAGRRIAAAYLSKLNWAREWRRTLNRQLYPAVLREELEAKERQCDQLEEEAEAQFSSEYERWRTDPSPVAQAVRRQLYEILGQRRDLGFFGQRIVDRLRREFTQA